MEGFDTLEHVQEVRDHGSEVRPARSLVRELHLTSRSQRTSEIAPEGENLVLRTTVEAMGQLSNQTISGQLDRLHKLVQVGP